MHNSQYVTMTTRRFPYALWGQIPLGYDDLAFCEAGDVVWTRRRFCCSFCCGGQGVRRFAPGKIVAVTPGRRPTCSDPILWARDVFWSFVAAFLSSHPVHYLGSGGESRHARKPSEDGRGVVPGVANLRMPVSRRVFGRARRPCRGGG